ncbi:MAG: hypothetical protein H6739_32500 [Alphaproteobacteria bacterium]|nr:hypothetical protein [Alphaproteobacteria bacterium]
MVRLPAMRASVFLMPTEDAPRIFAATPLPGCTVPSLEGGFDGVGRLLGGAVQLKA